MFNLVTMAYDLEDEADRPNKQNGGDDGLKLPPAGHNGPAAQFDGDVIELRKVLTLGILQKHSFSDLQTLKIWVIELEEFIFSAGDDTEQMEQ